MDGTLVIKEVDKDQDNSNYTCKAKNFKGEDSVTTIPIVLGKKEITIRSVSAEPPFLKNTPFCNFQIQDPPPD